MAKPTPPMTAAQMQALIATERRTRAERCLAEVQAAIAPILKKHNCEIACTPVIVDGRILANWGINPLELAPPA